jgi:hypothetical protein
MPIGLAMACSTSEKYLNEHLLSALTGDGPDVLYQLREYLALPWFNFFVLIRQDGSLRLNEANLLIPRIRMDVSDFLEK